MEKMSMFEDGQIEALEAVSPEIPMTKGAMRYLVELASRRRISRRVEIGGRFSPQPVRMAHSKKLSRSRRIVRRRLKRQRLTAL